jgi:4-hydroxybenzoate decarboxylase subunit C
MTRAFRDLRSFLKAVEKRKELRVIDVEVDPDLEAAEIHRRVIAEGGPVLLFKRIRGSPFPVVTNLFGTRERVKLAFGEDPQQLVAQIAKLPEKLVPPSLGRVWKERRLVRALLKTGLKQVKKAPVLAVREDGTAGARLPILRTWAEDGGPFLTLPLVLTSHPDGHGTNLGIYRMQRYQDGRFGMHFQIGKGGGFHLAEAESRGQDLPVQVFLGGPPALILAAIAPLPENVPELLFASLMLGGRLRVASDGNGSMPIAADAEVALLGHIPKGERRPEGPFGDHYGYYSLKHDYPTFRCKTVLRRQEPIIPATVVGKPRQEDFYIGEYLQELLAPLFPIVMPGVRDLWSYGDTGFHSLAAAVVKDRYRREAMMSAFRILGEGQLSLTKFLLVVDQPMDLKDFRKVLEHVLERADFRTDLYVFDHMSMDSLDYAGPKINEGSKGILLGLGDPIRKLPDQFDEAQAPPDITRLEIIARGCLVISGPSYEADPRAAKRLAGFTDFRDWPLIVLVDDAKAAAASIPAFLWTTFTRFAPATDIQASRIDLVGRHLGYTPPVIIDARKKPTYPAELACDAETAAKVDRRWQEYFPG